MLNILLIGLHLYGKDMQLMPRTMLTQTALKMFGSLASE